MVWPRALTMLGLIFGFFCSTSGWFILYVINVLFRAAIALAYEWSKQCLCWVNLPNKQRALSKAWKGNDPRILQDSAHGQSRQDGTYCGKHGNGRSACLFHMIILSPLMGVTAGLSSPIIPLHSAIIHCHGLDFCLGVFLGSNLPWEFRGYVVVFPDLVSCSRWLPLLIYFLAALILMDRNWLVSEGEEVLELLGSFFQRRAE